MVKRITAPPFDCFAEAGIDMLKDRNIDGGREAIAGALEIARLRDAPQGEYIETYDTDPSINP